MTYLRRPFSSWQAVGWVAFMVWLAGTNGYAIHRSVGSEFAFGAVAIFSLNLWRHLYDQMEDPRRRLVPEFFRVTTTVFFTVGLAMVAVPPIIGSGTGGVAKAIAIDTMREEAEKSLFQGQVRIVELSRSERASRERI